MRILTKVRKQEIIAEVLAARENREQFLLEMKQRQQEGLAVAKKCAKLLKEKYGVTKVVLFGSLLDHQKMTHHSDIDLAVWDLPEGDYFKAVADLDAEHDFEIDLVEIQQAQPYILEAIQQLEIFLRKLNNQSEAIYREALVNSIALNVHGIYTGIERIFAISESDS